VYKCACGHKWSDHPGPWECPHCGSQYLEWLNYKSIDWLRDQHGAA
jgi:rubredoxin